MNYGCIGEKLGHSFSREIHQRLADYTYELQELAPQEVAAFIQAKAFSAINVTIPYKQTVIPYLDQISPRAEAIGAVNTVVNKNGKLYGYNTDFWGMQALIRHIGVDPKGKKVLILGSGGTSKTARAVCREMDAGSVWVVSRSGKEGITYEDAMKNHSDTQLIINTTPCGMYPNIQDIPVKLNYFPRLEGVVDAIYNPLRTQLVYAALQQGLPAAGGLYMLVAQAVYAVEFFLDQKIPASEIDRVYGELMAEKENIILTGMPGAGKSTVGRKLAAALNKRFLDTDDLITQAAGKAPGQIIEQEGEAAFRDMESRVIREQAAPLNGCVIATGGGAILRDENVRNLKLNGRFCFLNRPLDTIKPTPNRPLSQNRELLQKRFEERYPRYMETADLSVISGETADITCNKLLEELKK